MILHYSIDYQNPPVLVSEFGTEKAFGGMFGLFKITATKKTTVNLYIFQTGIAFPYPDSAINIYNAHVSFGKEWIGNIDMVLDKDQMPVSANLMYIMNPNFATIQVLNIYSGTSSYQYYYSHDMTQPLNT